MVEWNESEGAVKRTYHGLGKQAAGVVQFDTTKNRILAAGDECMVKFWDMDSVNLLTSTDAEGGLQVLICGITMFQAIKALLITITHVCKFAVVSLYKV